MICDNGFRTYFERIPAVESEHSDMVANGGGGGGGGGDGDLFPEYEPDLLKYFIHFFIFSFTKYILNLMFFGHIHFDPLYIGVQDFRHWGLAYVKYFYSVTMGDMSNNPHSCVKYVYRFLKLTTY